MPSWSSHFMVRCLMWRQGITIPGVFVLTLWKLAFNNFLHFAWPIEEGVTPVLPSKSKRVTHAWAWDTCDVETWTQCHLHQIALNTLCYIYINLINIYIFIYVYIFTYIIYTLFIYIYTYLYTLYILYFLNVFFIFSNVAQLLLFYIMFYVVLTWVQQKLFRDVISGISLTS